MLSPGGSGVNGSTPHFQEGARAWSSLAEPEAPFQGPAWVSEGLM